MKKLLVIGTVILITLVGFGAVIAVVSRVTARQESQAELQARLAEQQASAEFWRGVIWIAVALVALVLIPVIIWLFGKAFDPFHRRQMERLRFERDYSVLAYDPLGNGPVIFDRQNMQLITVDPGNNAFPAQFHFVNGAMPQQVKEPRRSPEQPLVIYTNGQGVARPGETRAEGYSVKEIEPDQLPAADRSRRVQTVQAERSDEGLNGDFEPERSERSENDRNFGELLRQAKEGSRGRNKEKWITEITGVKKGGSEAWKVYSDFWDSIEV